MFACITCTGTFSKEDVKSGLYFPSTGICLHCYQKMAKNPKICFGDRKMYNRSSIACRVECPDKKICKVFIKIELK